MASHRYWKTSGLFLVIFTIVAQSIPIEKTKNVIQSPSIDNKPAVNEHVQKFINMVKDTSISTTEATTKPTDTVSTSSLSTSQTTDEKTDNKKKRFIEDDDDNNDDYDLYFGNENNELNSFDLPYFKTDNIDDTTDHKLNANVEETPAKIHDNTDKVLDTDDSKVFSDIKMSPSELTTIVRRRRSLKLNDALSSRRKRALSPYDLYDSDSLYDSYVDPLDYDRYPRSFAPLYWYPNAYKRNIRSSLLPFVDEMPNYPIIYAPVIDSNNIDENPLPDFDGDDDDDDDDDDNHYELNRYPVLVAVPNDPPNNLELQEQYNIDDLPIGENIEDILTENDNDDSDDDDGDDGAPYPLIYQRERPYLNRYEPLETYF